MPGITSKVLTKAKNADSQLTLINISELYNAVTTYVWEYCPCGFKDFVNGETKAV